MSCVISLRLATRKLSLFYGEIGLITEYHSFSSFPSWVSSVFLQRDRIDQVSIARRVTKSSNLGHVLTYKQKIHVA